eukprot:15221955-Ditylum_brightwellii.AAC.1
MKIQHAGAQTSQNLLEDVCFLMKSDEESKSSDSSIPDDVKQSVKVNKLVQSNCPTILGDNHFAYSTILDSGTKWTVLGGPAWLVQQKYDKMLSMSAVDGEMKIVSIPVMAVLNGDGQVHLFGIKHSMYSATLTHNEAVVNGHLIYQASWGVDCISKIHGGLQCV